MGLKGYLAAGHESKGGSAGRVREREKDQPCAINSLMFSAAALSAETIIYSAPFVPARTPTAPLYMIYCQTHYLPTRLVGKFSLAVYMCMCFPDLMTSAAFLTNLKLAAAAAARAASCE
jgi:hypothetical protein